MKNLSPGERVASTNRNAEIGTLLAQIAKNPEYQVEEKDLASLYTYALSVIQRGKFSGINLENIQSFIKANKDNEALGFTPPKA